MKNNVKKLKEYKLSEEDFYPPEDTRILHSGVEDIDDGDNFNDYLKYFFSTYYDEYDY